MCNIYPMLEIFSVQLGLVVIGTDCTGSCKSNDHDHESHDNISWFCAKQM
jgi:hypothetical protein